MLATPRGILALGLVSGIRPDLGNNAMNFN